MSNADNQPLSSSPTSELLMKSGQTWKRLLRKLAIWFGFLVLIYIARDFFFAAFLTFLICYYTLAIVGWGMNRLSPDRERTWLRRLMTIGVFVCVPVLLLGIGVLISPHLVAQGQRLSGWLRYASPETEAARLLEEFVGHFVFQSEYGRQGSEAYQKGLEKFRQRGESHALEYNGFPSLQAWIEGSIVMPLAEEEREQIRSWLVSEGTSSKAFSEWFLQEKAPQLADEAQLKIPEKGRPEANVSSLVRAAATNTPEQLLEQARRDPSELDRLKNEWIEDTLKNEFDQVISSPSYLERLKKAYELQRQKTPETIPYSFEEYTELSKVRQQGRRAFGEVLGKLRPPPVGESAADKERRLRADFEAATKHDLFQRWWGTNSVAKFIRHQLQAMVDPDAASGRIERIVGSLLNVPIDLATALTISIFICIDFVNLKKSLPLLRKTWLRDVYDEMAPALVDMGHLVGRFMQLQGFIAMCSAVLTSIGLSIIGVEHVLLLGLATFILCLVPTIGSVFAIIVIMGFALFQYGGGLSLAIEAGLVATAVSLIESFILSPHILGKRMDLHPVVIVIVLPLAQYFFGIWGLILATPVAVYVVHVLILERGLPGITSQSPAEHSN